MDLYGSAPAYVHVGHVDASVFEVAMKLPLKQEASTCTSAFHLAVGSQASAYSDDLGRG